MSRSASKKKRDDLKAMLAGELASSNSAGSAVAAAALDQSTRNQNENDTRKVPFASTAPNSANPKPSAKPTKNRGSTHKSRPLAQKVSISLHPEDLERVEAIKSELRKLGCRTASDSLAIRVAVAGFKLDRDRLQKEMAKAKERDGRTSK